MKLRACLAAFSALDPETKPDTSLEVGVVPKAAGASVTVLDGVSESATAAVTQKDELTTTFLARQLRLLLVHASGQNGENSMSSARPLLYEPNREKEYYPSLRTLRFVAMAGSHDLCLASSSRKPSVFPREGSQTKQRLFSGSRAL